MPDAIQRRALETWHSENFDKNLQAIHAALGLAGEAGEVADEWKKYLFKPGHDDARPERLKELGDALYYLSILAWLDGCTLDELSRMNYAKLTANGDNHGWQPNYYRYAEGDGTPDRAGQAAADGV